MFGGGRWWLPLPGLMCRFARYGRTLRNTSVRRPLPWRLVDVTLFVTTNNCGQFEAFDVSSPAPYLSEGQNSVKGAIRLLFRLANQTTHRRYFIRPLVVTLANISHYGCLTITETFPKGVGATMSAGILQL